MKRPVLIWIWLLVPALVAAFHFGPGQASFGRDKAAGFLSVARRAEAQEKWTAAIAAYDRAIEALPREGSAEARLRILQARSEARILVGDLPEAIEDLRELLSKAQGSEVGPELAASLRESLASAQYHAAWLMRLEGAERSEWTAQNDDARQHFRWLAENAPAERAGARGGHLKNLEATLRLAQMDISELQGLPLPKKCSNCNNCSQKCRSQKESRQQAKSENKDARNGAQAVRPTGHGS